MAKKNNGSMDEQVGFHKGALSVLIKEREEMARILSIVEQLIKMHTQELKDLGIDMEKELKPLEKKKGKPIEELI